MNDSSDFVTVKTVTRVTVALSSKHILRESLCFHVWFSESYYVVHYTITFRGVDNKEKDKFL